MQSLFKCKNISEVSRAFKVSRKTLKKWEARYYKDGIEGLKDKSKTPKSCPKKISKDIENLIIDIKTKHPELGVRRIKKILETNHNTHLSIHPIHRVLKSAGLIKNGNHVK